MFDTDTTQHPVVLFNRCMKEKKKKKKKTKQKLLSKSLRTVSSLTM